MNAPGGGAPVRGDELKRALLAIRDLRRRVQELEGRAREPVAIVGMACRFPGGADSPERLWELLREGVDATGDIPDDRWDLEALYDPDPDAIGRIYSRRGGFLREPVDRFDAAFFGISPREAAGMDPVQRMLLELTWEALERAGIPPRRLEGTPTGVFVGVSNSDYDVLQRNSGYDEIHAYRGTGTMTSVAVGRLSHSLDLQGPNYPIDTACSSGLVALVVAVEQLRSGRCNVALAGSASLMLAPDATIFLCRMRALSARGQCRTFDASADGYARGEGGAMLILKRLSDAQADGDPILAVIHGAAANHDGRSSGLTVPNPAAQRSVIQAALESGGLAPSDVAYVEAHGTATPLGDPIELRALSETLCVGRDPGAPLLVGSAKTNFGHLEPTAGLVGVMKVVLSLQHGAIPPHLHFREPTPHVDWDSLGIQVPTALTSWPPGDRPRLAGVSAFGFSGTNGHVILGEAPPRPPRKPLPTRPVELLALSGRSPVAVRELAGRYRRLLEGGARLQDLAVTSTAGRSHLPMRTFASGADPMEMVASLTAIEEGGEEAIASSPSGGGGRIAFLFTGQGSQYPGMARDLYGTSRTFREALERCSAIADPHMDRPLLPLLLDAETPGMASDLQQTACAQPALFALEYALSRLWQSWGVTPSFVVGHSLGEFVAATVAGVMTLEEALPLVVRRGQLMQELPSGGRMAAVLASEEKVAAAIASLDGVSIAAVNAPQNVVISGEGDAVGRALEVLQAAGLKTAELKVSHAFHSRLMEPILQRFEEAVGSVTLRPPKIRLISNVTGVPMTDAEATDPARWRRHIREAVRFADSIQTLGRLGATSFVEIGPHPTLCGMGMDALPGGKALWLPSLRRGGAAWVQLTDSLGALYAAGYDLDWDGWAREYEGHRVPGPTYPFQRLRHWFRETTGASEWKPVGAAGPRARHPLLGSRILSPALDGSAWQVVLSPEIPSYMKDHRAQGHVIVPGAVFMEMMGAAGREGAGWSGVLEDVEFQRPLVLPEGESVTCQLLLGPTRGGVTRARVVSAVAEGTETLWVTHAVATLRPLESTLAEAPPALEELRREIVAPIDVGALYANLEGRGIQYGPAFHPIVEGWRGSRGVLGRLQIPLHGGGDPRYHAHPCLVDGGFQLLAGLLEDTGDSDFFLPAGVDWMHVRRPVGHACWAFGRVRERGSEADPDELVADLNYYDDSGELIAVLEGFRSRRVRGPLGRPGTDHLVFDMDWQPCPPPTASNPAPGTWLILGADGPTVDHLAAAIADAGGRTVRMGAGDDPAALLATEPVDGVLVVETDRPLPRASNEDTGGASDTGARLLDDVLGSTSAVVSVLQRSVHGGAPGRLRLVTRGAVGPGSSGDAGWHTASALWGLHSVIQGEYPEMDCRALDLDPHALDDGEVVLRAVLGDSHEDRMMVRSGEFLAPRLVQRSKAPVAPDRRPLPAGGAYQVNIERRGTLDALRHVPLQRREPEPGEVEVRVRATGLNFRDVLNVLGMYPGDPGRPGVEFGGVVVRVGSGVDGIQEGDEVIGIGEGAFASHLTVVAAAVVPAPPGLSLDQAMSIPLPFLTAEWGLSRLGRLRAGERVLIHAAAGGVGQAAVQIARAAGAEVFATAGSDWKRDLIRAQGVVHVFDSRSPSFADGVLAATGGEGVDVVLNSLTGEMLHRSLELLRPGGRFLELGKAELLTPEEVAQQYPGVEYSAFDVGYLLIDHPQLFQELFRGITDRFATGELRPLQVRTYPAEEIVDAFRFMAQARHVGKLVVAAGRPSPAEGAILPDGSYLVTGGAGGIGRLVVEWLAGRGAGAVVLNARSLPDPDTRAWMEGVQNSTGAHLEWIAGDVTRLEDAVRVVEGAGHPERPLRGIFHAAGVLDDGLLLDQTRGRMGEVLAPKVAGGWNLHTATTGFDLDHFVLFSSVAAVLGGPGQGAYAAANNFLGALARHRSRQGLAALCIDWGAWAGQGMAARLSDRERRMLKERGLRFLEPATALAALARLCGGTNDRALVADIEWRTLAAAARRRLPLLKVVAADAGDGQGARPTPGPAAALDPAQLAALPPEERTERLTGFVCATLSGVLGIQGGEIHGSSEIAYLGFDSLMAMELRNRIETGLGVVVPVAQLLGSSTPEDLARQIAEVLETPIGIEGTPGEGVDNVESFDF